MADAIGIGLRRAGMVVDIAYDGCDGLARALADTYDVVVLDRDVPGTHGDDVCAALIDARCRSRILMLTAAASMDAQVDGLDRGADDYLPKPFDFPILVARIGALFRRAQPALPPVLQFAGLALDITQRRATRGERALDLSPKEFGVRELLLA